LITVYTCIAGRYDSLIQQKQFEDVEYVCFCDVKQFKSHKGWKLLPLISPEDISAPNLINRYHKMLAYHYFDSNYSVYIDGNVVLKADPKSFTNFLEQKQQYLGMFRHPERDNISQELEAILSQRRIEGEMISRAIEFVTSSKNEGFFNQNGLSGNYIIVRKVSHEALKTVMHQWWEVVVNIVDRDQLSLQYLLWKVGLDWSALDCVIQPKKAFIQIPHGYYLPFISIVGQAFLKKVIIKFKLFFGVN